MQVPLELRCATESDLRNWTGPEYLFWFYFNRNLPYDPVRPWVDHDGRWYATISADGCNNTVPCGAGGAEFLFSSPALRGPTANWQLIGPMFVSNWTVLTPYKPASLLNAEFVTADYFGYLTGDPRGGATRCLLNNLFIFGGTTTYFCGTQQPGKQFIVNYSDPAATGMIDWGVFGDDGTGTPGIPGLTPNKGGTYMMARTLSPQSPNQVAAPGRKIITAWINGNGGTAQALPRDLSLDPETGELLQAFSPELQLLRLPSKDSGTLPRSGQMEIYAQFAVTATADPARHFGLLLQQAEDGAAALELTIDRKMQRVKLGGREGPLLAYPAPHHLEFDVHVIIDHVLVTVIVNNRTAITALSSPQSESSTLFDVVGVDDVDTTLVHPLQAWALRDAETVDA